MSNPIVLHVVRPYQSEEEYLAAEAWSIDAKSMLLIGQRRLPPDTAVLFDVALGNGHKVIKAEARVVGAVAAKGDRPGGLRVRFKRFGATTKAFIDRAVAAHAAAAEAQPAPPSAPSSPEPGSAPLAAPAPVSAPEETRDRPSTPEAAPASDRRAEVAPPPAEKPAQQNVAAERSGIHRRVVAPVPAPPNREELLEKLRARSRALAKARAANVPSERTG